MPTRREKSWSGSSRSAGRVFWYSIGAAILFRLRWRRTNVVNSVIDSGGKTLEPCTGIQYALLSPSGEAYTPDNGAIGVDNLKRVYRINEGRVGTAGQLFNAYLNKSSTPYVWSVIRFDSFGHFVTPSSGSETDSLSIYSSFATFTGGNFTNDTIDLIQTNLQSDIEAFVVKDQGYFYKGPK